MFIVFHRPPHEGQNSFPVTYVALDLVCQPPATTLTHRVMALTPTPPFILPFFPPPVIFPSLFPPSIPPAPPSPSPTHLITSLLRGGDLAEPLISLVRP